MDTPRTVCAYSGVPFHQEMIGYVLASCPTATVFVNGAGDIGWLDLYRDLFPAASFRPHTDFNDTEAARHDTVVLLTDDDSGMPTSPAVEAKLLCVDHSSRERRTLTAPTARRVGVRPFRERPDLQHVLPTYRLVGEAEKRRSLWSSVSDTAAVHVVCVGGYLWQFATMDDFRRDVCAMFPGNSERHTTDRQARPLHFHLFHRGAPTMFVDDDPAGRGRGWPHSLTTYVRADAKTMTDVMRSADYFLVAPPRPGDGQQRSSAVPGDSFGEAGYEKDYCHDNMTGAVPLAFSTGCRLIMSERWKDAYGVTSPVSPPSSSSSSESPFLLTPLAEAGAGVSGVSGVDVVYEEARALWHASEELFRGGTDGGL